MEKSSWNFRFENMSAPCTTKFYWECLEVKYLVNSYPANIESE